MKNNTKKYILCIFIGLILVLVTIYSIGLLPEKLPKTVVFEAFDATEADCILGEIIYKGVFYKKTKNMDDIEAIGKDLMDLLEITNVFSYKIVSNDVFEKLEIEGTTGKDNILSIDFYGYKAENNKNKKEVKITATQYEKYNALAKIREDLKSFSRKYNISSSYSLHVAGYFDKKIDLKSFNRALNKVVTIIGASNVEGRKNENLISIKVNSKVLGNSQFSMSNSNVDISLRYNEIEDRTYIWMSTSD